MLLRGAHLLVVAFVLASASAAYAQAPVAYRLSFPEPEHRWMQVEVTFPDVPPGPLQLHMSRSSPGRYALHEFAKNVFDVRVTDRQASRSRDAAEPAAVGRTRSLRHCARAATASSAIASTARICRRLARTRTSTCRRR